VKRAEGIHRKHLMNQTSANKVSRWNFFHFLMKKWTSANKVSRWHYIHPVPFGLKHFSLQGKGLLGMKHLS